MSQGVPSRLIATMMALAAFAVAVVAGLSAGNPATLVLGRALACMIVCQAVGLAIGVIGERVAREHIQSSASPVTAAPGGAPSHQPQTGLRSENAAAP